MRLCNHITRIKLTEDELEAYKDYLAGGQYIQECLPTLNKCEREFLKNGYCIKCQKMLFGNGNTKNQRNPVLGWL